METNQLYHFRNNIMKNVDLPVHNTENVLSMETNQPHNDQPTASENMELVSPEENKEHRSPSNLSANIDQPVYFLANVDKDGNIEIIENNHSADHQLNSGAILSPIYWYHDDFKDFTK